MILNWNQMIRDHKAEAEDDAVYHVAQGDKRLVSEFLDLELQLISFFCMACESAANVIMDMHVMLPSTDKME